MTEIYWDWTESNGTATAEQTQKAYTALTEHGPTRDFAAVVWNDLIDMISAQRVSWENSAWDESILSISDAKMSSGSTMTADRFNSAVANIWPITDWPWAETLGRTTILKGDRCNGSYFLDLAFALNRWAIDIERLFLSFSLQGAVDIKTAVSLCDSLFVRFLLDIQSSGMSADISLCDALRIAFSVNLATRFALTRMNVAQALLIGFDNTIRAIANLDSMLTADALLTGFSDEASVYTHMAVIGGYPLYTAFSLAFSASALANVRLAQALCTGFGLSAACTSLCDAAAGQVLPIRFDLSPVVETDVDVVNAATEMISIYLPVKTQISVSVGFKEPRLVLAEELDGILAGTLDDRLVSNVELDFT